MCEILEFKGLHVQQHAMQSIPGKFDWKQCGFSKLGFTELGLKVCQVHWCAFVLQLLVLVLWKDSNVCSHFQAQVFVGFCLLLAMANPMYTPGDSRWREPAGVRAPHGAVGSKRSNEDEVAPGGSLPKRLKNKQHQPAGWADYISTPGPSEPISLGKLDWPSIKTAMDLDYLCVPFLPVSLPLLADSWVVGGSAAKQPGFPPGLEVCSSPFTVRLPTDEVGDNIQQMEARRSKVCILLHQLLRDGPSPHPTQGDGCTRLWTRPRAKWHSKSWCVAME